MKSILKIICLFFIFFESLAWNENAHMTVAAMAWDRLNDSEKEKVTAILLLHPQYGHEWKTAYIPHKSLLPLGKYLMMRASTWPEEIKKPGNANIAYSRPEWHYITQKLYFDREIDETKPEVQAGKNNENVVWAIGHVTKSLQNKEISGQLKAVYFSWLIYLTANIHQPLNTCSLFDSDKLKKGDKGGSEIYVRTSTDTTSLQQFWDNLTGSETDTKMILRQGFNYRKQVPFKDDYLNPMNPESWALQSFLLAKHKVYLNGKLNYSVSNKIVAPKLADVYIEEAKTLVIQQISIAGYRLGAQINQFFSSTK